MTGFLQKPPVLEDAWASDRSLRDALRFHLGPETFDVAEPQFQEMGRIATDEATLALAAQAEREPPVHVPFSAFGERIDEIEVSDAYTELGRIGVRAGVASIPYEDAYAEKARLVWAGVNGMWGPSSGLYSCPIAMTDAAARTLLVHGDESDRAVVDRLTTRDVERAWTSGQWMTETAGGSDISRTGTIARRGEDGRWRLFGTKWFTSATTSEMALTLARPEGAGEGSRPLAMFRIQRVLDDGARNAIVVRRLKDKLGTRSLPTAELELEGAIAHPVGDPLEGGGVRRIATMLNITRIHNALASAGSLSRGLAWARAYARVREVFGQPLHSLPAHRATLTDLAVDHAAALALVLRCCELTGRGERGVASGEELALLRGLTPVTKLTTARWAVAGVAEAMEAVGGVGYCEDSTIPALVRNTHVQPIWEGTTNVLSLDLLRSARDGAVEALLVDIEETTESVTDPALTEALSAVKRAAGELRDRWPRLEDDGDAVAGARSFAVSLGTTYACACLCRQATGLGTNDGRRSAIIANRLAARGLVAAPAPGDLGLAME